MDRLVSLLLLGLIAAVVGLGVVVVLGDNRAHDDAEHQRCLLSAQATATVALLAPAKTVDEQGRLDAIKILGQRIDGC